MPNYVKKVLICCFILLLLPVFFLISGWIWEPSMLSENLKPLYWITNSSGKPWAALTCFILLLLFIYLFRPISKREIIILTIFLASSVIAGQIAKSGIKTLLSYPRPYVEWISTQKIVESTEFYQKSRDERAILIDESLNNHPIIPSWLLHHWKDETGYSRPSGHTEFAACWIFLFIGFFGFRKYYILSLLLIIWGILVEYSRLILGMHWPIDLITGVIVGFFVALLFLWIAKKYSLFLPQKNN